MTTFPKPTAILLATDLSARSDRAQARAVQLARQWQASLVVLVALTEETTFSRANAYQDDEAPVDAPAAETPAAYFERRARQALADAGVPVLVCVLQGKPGPLAVDTARQYGCGLIVTGSSRSDVAMRMEPGSTLRWLARNAGVPVLAVNDRVHADYRQLTMASDFSPASEAALQLADAWFSDVAQRTLLHAYTIPLPTLSLDDHARVEALAALQAQTEGNARTHLSQALGAGAAHWQLDVRAGGPVRLLREHAREAGTDLTVIASHGRSKLLDKLVGSVAERLLETVGTDLLVVRPLLA
ncbi:MAG: universal stress protein [Xanthomonadaceae bacterium]|nr:universal stress protein [Xanthomonadaceae bacterium]